jgi:type IV pilus assembly protein PilA
MLRRHQSNGISSEPAGARIELPVNEYGFTLLELILVIAVLLTIAAIAIPNLINSKASANEAAAVSSVRLIHSMQVAYATSYPAVGFADSLSKLGPPDSGASIGPLRAGLLDSTLGCIAQPCSQNGYNLQIDQTDGPPVTTFRVTAVPTELGRSGHRGFCGSSAGALSADLNGGTACAAAVSGRLPEL